MHAVGRALLIGVALSATWSEPAAQTAASFTRVAPDLYFYYTGGAANSTVLVTNDGVLIIDAQGNRQAAEALLADIRCRRESMLQSGKSWSSSMEERLRRCIPGSARCVEWGAPRGVVEVVVSRD